jgi:hypothetical protein
MAWEFPLVKIEGVFNSTCCSAESQDPGGGKLYLIGIR